MNIKQIKENINNKFNNPEKDKIEISTFILDGINEKYKLRNYQEEAIKRFIYYWNNKEYYQNQINSPNLFDKNKNHFLFNIATGGGKTLLMASLILYLHNEYNYNNFLFLSHLNSINTKTRENFLNKDSSKYLFNKNIIINEVNNFDFNDNKEINLMINTYQGISSLLNSVKENSFNLKDIKNKKIVIIADESHHLNRSVETGIRGENAGIWENSVNKILNSNENNILLEWTATIQWKKEEFYKKYKDKCIYIYDLESFYRENWTKNISLLNRIVNFNNLIFGAIILNKYRQVLFENKLNKKVKPVILFKSKTIKESKENHNKFNELIENLDDNYINDFEKTLKVGTITKIALDYLKNSFKNNLVNILKSDFNEDFVINTNDEKELNDNAFLLNTLEEESNKKRVIFTVDKLNEGWDVLNLFDIVKLYETNTITETTQEAQLIGRGARLFPFDYENKDKYKRKFDETEELGILEQLYFHSRQDNMAIAKLKKELEKTGIILKEQEKIEIKLKKNLIDKIGNKIVFYNKKTLKLEYDKNYDIYEDIKRLSNRIKYTINSNKEISINLMDEKEIVNNLYSLENTNIVSFKDFNYNTKKSAIVDNINYNFENLYKKIRINSFDDFIEKLDLYEIRIENWKKTFENEYLIYTKFLNDIYEKIISKEIKKYVGTKEFIYEPIIKVFKEKILNREFVNGQQKQIFIADNFEYYLYQNSQLTSEELDFLNFFNLKIYNKLKNKFKEIYLIRNEKDLKLYDFKNADGFEPDFILLLKDDEHEYNIYIEPKGNHLLKNDEWKNSFLKEITQLTKENKLNINNLNVLRIEIFKEEYYKILGFQFYNKNIEETENRMENEFKDFFDL